MSETNELSLKAFKERLSIYFSKENGEKSVENGIEKFSKIVVSQNKDDNPFFYSELLSSIKSRNITLGELNASDSKVMNEIIKEAIQRAIVVQNQVRENQKAQITSNNLTEEIDQTFEKEKLLKIQEVDNLIEKYGGIENFYKNATNEEFETYTNIRKEEKLFTEADSLIAKIVRNPNDELNDEERRILTESSQGKRFGYNPETNSFSNHEEAKKYVISLEEFRKEIERAIGNTGEISEEELSKIKGRPEFKIISEIKSNEEILQLTEQLKKEKAAKENEIRSGAVPSDKLEMSDGNNTIKISPEQLMSEIELAMDGEFANAMDFFIDNKEIGDETLLGLDNKLGDSIQSWEDSTGAFEEISADSRIPEVPEVAKVDEIQPQEELGTDEQTYEAPTFEVEEKKGLAKFFDKFRNSNNPIAKLLFNRTKRMQSNDAKRLEAASVERNITEYKEKPSTGRFDLSDSELIPRGASIRNTFIRMGETVAKLFGKKDKEPEPTQTLVPQTPSNSFDAMVKKGIDDKVMDGIAEVSQQVAQQDGKPIVPKAVGKGENAKPSGPSLDEE